MFGGQTLVLDRSRAVQHRPGADPHRSDSMTHRPGTLQNWSDIALKRRNTPEFAPTPPGGQLAHPGGGQLGHHRGLKHPYPRKHGVDRTIFNAQGLVSGRIWCCFAYRRGIFCHWWGPSAGAVGERCTLRRRNGELKPTADGERRKAVSEHDILTVLRTRSSGQNVSKSSRTRGNTPSTRHLRGPHPSRTPIERLRPPRGPLKTQKKPGRTVRAADLREDPGVIAPLDPFWGGDAP